MMLIKSFPDFDPDENSIKFQIIYSVFSKFKLTGSIKNLTIFIWWQ